MPRLIAIFPLLTAACLSPRPDRDDPVEIAAVDLDGEWRIEYTGARSHTWTVALALEAGAPLIVYGDYWINGSFYESGVYSLRPSGGGWQYGILFQDDWSYNTGRQITADAVDGRGCVSWIRSYDASLSQRCGETAHGGRAEEILDFSGSDLATAMDPDGDLHTIFHGEDGYTYVDEAGNTEVIHEGDWWYTEAVVAADAYGGLHVAFLSYVDDSDSVRTLYYARRSAGGAWSVEVIAEAGGYDTRGDQTNLAITTDAMGAPRIAWYDNSDDSLRFARQSAAGAWSVEELAGSDRAVTMAMTPDDREVIVFLSDDAQLRLAAADGEGGWLFEDLPTEQTPYTGSGPTMDLQIGADGMIHLAWVTHNYGEGSIYYAQRDPLPAAGGLLPDGPGYGELVITEIMANPAACSDRGGEWLEVYNPTGAEVDLEGLVVEDSRRAGAPIEGPLKVAPGAFAVIGRSNPEAWCHDWPPDAYWGASPALNNDGDRASIHLGDTLVDAAPAWERAEAGLSWSLELGALDADANDDPGAWCVGAPSAGAAGAPCGASAEEGVLGAGDLRYGDLVFTELMANPTDCADDACEWLEVINQSGQEVALSGLIVRDAAGNQGAVSEAVLAPGEVAALGRGDAAGFGYGFAPTAWYGAAMSLNNSGDVIELVTPAGELVDAVAFDEGPYGASLALDAGAADADANDDEGAWCEGDAAFGGGEDRGSPGWLDDCG